ncbi:Uncharacterised protein [uncultured Roseburia sp.]|uniref:Glycosyltransferase 99 N-terminal domain-containing protein n=1 Tax=Brotonthovivens ammoniilytica TaxID=2981725 RepID=A0ABT2TFA6_9FIRM|nr:hypothetical protein [Brotonthovivens ammoniilytica]MCU6760821.1 hypothetical protein [Brotonthovivens ammoniilytica]SCI10366.1 Uncharacterised protein [uncultured Roseburia sp.]
MYIPIIIDPCSFYESRYLWEYLKYLYHCYNNNWPIISTQYFINYRKNIIESNVYEKDFYSLHQYRLLSEEEENSVVRCSLSNDIFTNLERKLGSKLAVRLFLLENRYMPLEKEIKYLLRNLKKKFNQRIEGILNWNAHFVSIRYVAEKMGIPVITNEFCLRFPEYRPTAYFCYDEIYTSKEIKERYKNFVKQLPDCKFKLFSNKELLALFLAPEKLNLLDMYEISAKYEMGMAGCHPLIPTFFVKSKYTDLELLQDLRCVYPESDILFRMHPGDEPYRATYTAKNLDDSLSSSEFILKSNRIAAQGSNILLEAMLWGKKVYTHDISPFTNWCETNYFNLEGKNVPIEFLNFVLLAYLVPYELICDEKYLNWRKSRPSEIKLFMCHLKYYLQKDNIYLNLLDFGKKNRYKIILERRKNGEI